MVCKAAKFVLFFIKRQNRAALRRQDISAECDLMERSVKAQLKYADKLGARYVAVIGENELAEGAVNLKKMSDGSSVKLPFGEICNYLKKGEQNNG